MSVFLPELTLLERSPSPASSPCRGSLMTVEYVRAYGHGHGYMHTRAVQNVPGHVIGKIGALRLDFFRTALV